MQVKHVHGNLKINITKLFSFIISRIIFFFFKLIYPNVKSNHNEILISRATYSPWKSNYNYFKFTQEIKDLTLLDQPRLYTFYYLINQIKLIDADVLDIGCMKGGVGLLLSKQNKKGRTLLLDTFEGFKDKEKLHNKDVFRFTGIDEIKFRIKKYKLKKTFVYKKYFPQNVKDLKLKKIKLCHIDVNTYKSTKKSFYFVKNKMVKNGFIIFDDYGMHGVENVTFFLNELIKKEKKNFHYFFNYFGQCILLKK